MKNKSVPAEEVVEEDKDINEFKPFQVITGGKDPEEPESPHWLANVPEGWMFHTAQRGQTAAMFAQVLQHFEKTTVCFDLLNQVKFNVVTSRFSNNHEKLQVLPILTKPEGFDPEAEDPKEETTNGISDKL